MWTRWSHQPEVPLSVTEPAALPPGPARALVQIWHRDGIGAELGHIEVWRAGAVVTTRPITGRRFPEARNGGLQEELVDFEATGEPVQVAVYSGTGPRIWVGAIRLLPAAPQPVWVVEHCANTRARVDRAVADGANAVELDVQWTASGRLLVDHPPGTPAACWLARTADRDVEPLLGHLGALMAADRLSLVIIDVKQPWRDVQPFAQALVTTLDRAGLPADQVVVSIDRRYARTFLDAMHAAPRAEPYTPWVDAWHDIATGARPDDWVAQAVGDGASFLSVGADPIAVHQPMPMWFEPLVELVNARERGDLARAMTWTLERRVSMRSALDLGLDAIIVNEPRRLAAVLDKEPYATLYRLGEAADLRGPLRASAP